MKRNYVILGAVGGGLAITAYLITRRKDAARTPVTSTEYVYPAGPTGGYVSGDDVIGGSGGGGAWGGPTPVVYPASVPPSPLVSSGESFEGCTNMWGSNCPVSPVITQPTD